MKQLVECTHTYNGRPVKVMSYFDYMNSPDYVLIMDPQSGETMKVPTNQLKPLGTLSVSSIKIVNKKDFGGKKKNTKKKDEKKKLKKESIDEAISDKISEFLNKKDKKTGLSLKDRYDGVVNAIKDLRTMGGIVYQKGKEYFALKEKNNPKVNVYQNAKNAVMSKQLNKDYQIMPLDVFNNYFSPKLAYVKENVIEEKKTKNFLKDLKKNAFHEYLGKSEDEEITDADIEKGLASPNAHVRKMANFAKNSRSWKH